MKNYTLEIVLFGSHAAGMARPGSDFDVLLVGNDFARHVVPQPLPHDEMGFYKPNMDVREHHRRKHSWSVELWSRLGGDVGVLELRRRALNYLTGLGYEATEKGLELFLYFPVDVSPVVWAVELAWQDVHARFDFVCDAMKSHIMLIPEMGEWQQKILASPISISEKATACEQELLRISGLNPNNEYRKYGSLSELRRGNAGHKKAVAQTGLC
jgi:predicted nucleotidyltransferase